MIALVQKTTTHLFQRPLVVNGISRSMGSFVQGVDFDTIAREWRCKWTDGNDRASLAEAQKALDAILPHLKALEGVKRVDRVVCGGNLDFKVITSIAAGPDFEAWKATEFSPESKFLAKLESIEGISAIETQTYTLMPM